MVRGKTGGDAAPKTGSFQAMNLAPELLKGISSMGYKQPTPVQRKSIPVCLLGGDVVCMARTGSGKTAAFVLPTLQKLISGKNGDTFESSSSNASSIKAVIMSPTRELCLQTLSVCKKLAKHCSQKINIVSIIGGDGMEKQFQALSSRPDILVATPGRLAHHLSEIPDFDLSSCEMCIFDEADRLFEMGFAGQMREITKSMPAYRQTLLFSATMPKMLAEFARSGLHDPTVVRLDNEANVSEELRLGFFTCRSLDKDAALLFLLRQLLKVRSGMPRSDANSSVADGKDKLTLIFAATRHHVEFLTSLIRSCGIDATCIYGLMDLEARKSNLASFRSGTNPVMVVTDVAARGIDVPLIHTVIHHSFPSSAKLFVHRSGRAARAGRIGYCFALVEPDEMPYMVDLHLFLGRKMTTSVTVTDIKDSNEQVKIERKYTIEEQLPEMVHYGSIPEAIITEEVENYRRLIENQTGNKDAESLQSQSRTCNNAMKQYRRSRPEASRASVRTAKGILAEPIPIHPLLSTMLSYNIDDSKMKDIIAREEFLQHLRKLKTKETIFETLAKDGRSTNMGSIDRTRNLNSSGNNSFAIMKAMRRQMRLVNGKNSLVIAGSDAAKLQNGELTSTENDQMPKGQKGGMVKTENSNVVQTSLPLLEQKKRLSKAERKRLKSGKGLPDDVILEKEKTKNKKDYRDENFYISFDDSSAKVTNRERHMEAQLLPSASDSINDPKISALKLQESILDIVGDEKEDLVKQQRLMRWDKSKRKYVQTTIGAETSGISKSKKLRLESGKLVQRKNVKLGELYEKWQKKNNKSIGRMGVFDDVKSEFDEDNAAAKIRSRAENKNNEKHLGKSLSKTSIQIQKERNKKVNTKMKNMKKKDRREVENIQSKAKGTVGGIGRKHGKIWSQKNGKR